MQRDCIGEFTNAIAGKPAPTESRQNRIVMFVSEKWFTGEAPVRPMKCKRAVPLVAPPFCISITALSAVPDPQQRIELCLGDQPLWITFHQCTSWIGLPDPDWSVVFQPLRNNLQRLVIHDSRVRSRLTCCIHFTRTPQRRERLTYWIFITEPCAARPVHPLEKQAN